MEWSGFALAFVAFFLGHSAPVRPPFRPILVRVLGAAGFGLAYSALSVAILTWLIVAAERAPFVPVWNWMPWQNYLVLAIMLPVCLIVALSIGWPNPFSFGGARNAAFDPARPGIVRLARHPLLVALALWSGAHLVANGDLAHILLFGTFFVYALFGRRLVDRRKRREMGQNWDLLWERVLAHPPGETLFPLSSEIVLRATLGVAIYAILIVLHPIVIGVDPMP
ncbi:NnrU family protein [Oricola indica]|uniref:NnrU family protein n=1 Tax=Oricola indica TaxID=2872591 RepID=UPI003CCBC6DB